MPWTWPLLLQLHPLMNHELMSRYPGVLKLSTVAVMLSSIAPSTSHNPDILRQPLVSKITHLSCIPSPFSQVACTPGLSLWKLEEWLPLLPIPHYLSMTILLSVSIPYPFGSDCSFIPVFSFLDTSRHARLAGHYRPSTRPTPIYGLQPTGGASCS